MTGSSEEDSYSLSNASSSTTINSNTTSITSCGGDDDTSQQKPLLKSANLPNGHLANSHPSGNSLISRDALILMPAELESDHVTSGDINTSKENTTQVRKRNFFRLFINNSYNNSLIYEICISLTCMYACTVNTYRACNT